MPSLAPREVAQDPNGFVESKPKLELECDCCVHGESDGSPRPIHCVGKQLSGGLGRWNREGNRVMERGLHWDWKPHPVVLVVWYMRLHGSLLICRFKILWTSGKKVGTAVG